MTATLIESHEPIEVKQICCLLYGQPGSRKSSLAQTADKPFTLAFDQGIYRAYGRQTCALFDTWADVVKLCADADYYRRSGKAIEWDASHTRLIERFTEAHTIVVDTLGMCLDKMSVAIAHDSPKNGNRMGGLSLQGYGVLKSLFAQWIAPMKSRGQDLVFVCHEKTEKLGDAPYYCPDITGGSYNTLMNVADAVGYMHFADGNRVIDWTPTDSWMAKTPPCGWTRTALLDFAQEPFFLAKLLAEAKASMGRISAESAKIAALVEEWRVWMDVKEPTLDQFNARIAAEFPTMDKTAKAQIWSLILATMARAGLVWDKAQKIFTVPQNSAQAPPPAEAPKKETTA